MIEWLKKTEEAIRLHIEQEIIRKKKVHEQEKVEQSLKEQQQQQQQQQQQVQQQQQEQQDNKNVDAVEDAIIEDPKEDLPHEVSSLNERQAIQQNRKTCHIQQLYNHNNIHFKKKKSKIHHNYTFLPISNKHCMKIPTKITS